MTMNISIKTGKTLVITKKLLDIATALEGATLKPNMTELAGVTGWSGPTTREHWNKLLSHYHLEIVVTLHNKTPRWKG